MDCEKLTTRKLQVRRLSNSVLYSLRFDTDNFDDDIRKCFTAIINNRNTLHRYDLAHYDRFIKNEFPDIDSKKATQENIVWFFYYLFEYVIQVETKKTAMAEVLSFLFGYDAEHTRQLFSKIHIKSDVKAVRNFENYKKEMLTVRKLFEMLGLTEVLKAIDNDISEKEKETEEML